MGIQRFGAPQERAPQQVMDNDENYIFQLSGSRAAPKTPQRQRGIWSFLVSPFVFSSLIALQSAAAKGNALTAGEEEDANGAAKRSNEANQISPDDQGAAISHAPDESVPDQTGSSGYSTARVQSAEAAAPEELKKSAMARNAEPAPNIAPPDGGGGGGGGDSDSTQDEDTSRAGNQNDLDTLGKSTIVLQDQSHGTTILPIAVDATTSGLHVGIGAVGEPLLPNILPSLDLGASLDGTALNLKNIVGFDVHLTSDGSFVEVGLGNTIDAHLSIPQAVNAVIGAAEELPVINLSGPNLIDQLLGGDVGTPTAHLTSIIDTHGVVATLEKPVTAEIGTVAKLTGTIGTVLSNAHDSVTLPGVSELLPDSTAPGHGAGDLLGTLSSLTSNIDAHDIVASLEKPVITEIGTAGKLTGTIGTVLSNTHDSATLPGTSELLPHSTTPEHVAGDIVETTTHVTSTIDTQGIVAGLDQPATSHIDTAANLTGSIGTVLANADHSITLPSLPELPHATSPEPVLATTPEPMLGDVLGQSGIVSTGNSIDFPATTPPAGDVLFSGQHYTDYHVALQGADPGASSITSSVPSSIDSPVETVAAQVPDPSAANHGDTHGQAETLPAAPHSDPPVGQLAHTLDDLNVRIGGH